MQTGSGDPAWLQLWHLTLHQCPKGRDDHDDATAHQSGQLIAERLAAAGGQPRQGVSPRQNGFHNRALPSPEAGPPEMFLERLFQTVQSTPDLVNPV